MALRILGDLDRTVHDYDNALLHLQSALRKYRQLGMAYGEALTRRAIGQTYAGVGDIESAQLHWCEALQLFEQLGNTSEADAVAKSLARLRVAIDTQTRWP